MFKNIVRSLVKARLAHNAISGRVVRAKRHVDEAARRQNSKERHRNKGQRSAFPDMVPRDETYMYRLSCAVNAAMVDTWVQCNARVRSQQLQIYKSSRTRGLGRCTESSSGTCKTYRPEGESFHLGPHDASRLRRLCNCSIAEFSVELHYLVASKCILGGELGIRPYICGVCYRRNNIAGHDHCSKTGLA